jgi:ABC-type tungstate transport system permease subunit
VLLNPYGSILVNPAKWPHLKVADARAWDEWLTSKAGLDAITSYRINGEQLFFPPLASTVMFQDICTKESAIASPMTVGGR